MSSASMNFGGPEVLRYEEDRDLEPGPGQVRIAVNAIGVHLIDASIRQGEEFGSLPVPTLPMTPGLALSLGSAAFAALLTSEPMLGHLVNFAGAFAIGLIAVLASPRLLKPCRP